MKTADEVIREAQTSYGRAFSWLTQVFPAKLRAIIENEYWRLRAPRGLSEPGEPFGSFYEFAVHPSPWGLGLTGETNSLSYQDAIRYCEVMPAGKPVARMLRDQLPALGEHGGERGQVDNVNLVAEPKGGNDSSYLTRRLKRDHPEIAEALAKGEFKSVRAAAIEAGIVRQKTPEDVIFREFGKLSRDRQEQLLDALGVQFLALGGAS